MSIVLFAMIGSAIDAGVAYWICFSVYCLIRLIISICNAITKGLGE